MRMRKVVSTQFVEFVPERLEEGVLYVSMEYATVAHKCLCGCGKEVVTPLSPTDWALTFDGESISLDPSVGNWSYPCQSHYWIRKNKVQWCGDMPQELIDAGRARDTRAKSAYYAGRRGSQHQALPAQLPSPSSSLPDARREKSRGGYLARFVAWISRDTK
jgi:hypothetical protein